MKITQVGAGVEVLQPCLLNGGATMVVGWGVGVGLHLLREVPQWSHYILIIAKLSEYVMIFFLENHK